jgi:hypothetical protein
VFQSTFTYEKISATNSGEVSMHYRTYEFEGRTQDIAAWAAEWNISEPLAYKRIYAYRRAKADGAKYSNFKRKRPHGFKQNRKPTPNGVTALLMPDEEWLPVRGWERFYRISNYGRVWSKHQYGRFVVGMSMDGGYRVVKLRDEDRRGHVAVHVMVLEAFVGPRPEGMEGCHNDGDPKNNRLGNLRWDTPAGNSADKKIHGTVPTTGATPVLTEDLVREIRTAKDMTVKQWTDRLGCSRQTIFSARVGFTWKHVDVPPVRKRICSP